jgi:hypothetical protein
MKLKLIAFALWLLKKCGYVQLLVPVEVQQYILEAKIAVNREETRTHGTSGEYKRHQAYSHMIKRFPAASKNHLALAIEIAVMGAM